MNGNRVIGLWREADGVIIWLGPLGLKTTPVHRLVFSERYGYGCVVVIFHGTAYIVKRRRKDPLAGKLHERVE